MRITKITVQWDNGSETIHSDPKGLDLGDIPGLMGLSPGSISDAQAGSLPGLISGLLTGLIGIAIKKLGLPI